MLAYKIAYIIENSTYLLVTVVCYVSIVKRFIKSRKAVKGPENTQGQSGQVPAATTPANNPDKSFTLSIKVAIVIGSQLLCWLPVHASIIASFFGFPPPKIITDVFITNIAPVNAIMNPCLHTEIMAKLIPLISAKISNIKDRILCLRQNAVVPLGEGVEMDTTTNDQRREKEGKNKKRTHKESTDKELDTEESRDAISQVGVPDQTRLKPDLNPTKTRLKPDLNSTSGFCLSRYLQVNAA